MAVRSVDLDCAAFGQVAEVIGKEAVFYAVDAQVKLVGAGGGSDGVGAGLGFAAIVCRDGGDELAGGEIEALHLVYSELEMVALGGFRDAGFLDEAGSVGLALQMKFSLQEN